jgi:hypothetical protein
MMTRNAIDFCLAAGIAFLIWQSPSDAAELRVEKRIVVGNPEHGAYVVIEAPVTGSYPQDAGISIFSEDGGRVATLSYGGQGAVSLGSTSGPKGVRFSLDMMEDTATIVVTKGEGTRLGITHGGTGLGIQVDESGVVSRARAHQAGTAPVLRKSAVLTDGTCSVEISRK